MTKTDQDSIIVHLPLPGHMWTVIGCKAMAVVCPRCVSVWLSAFERFFFVVDGAIGEMRSVQLKELNKYGCTTLK